MALEESHLLTIALEDYQRDHDTQLDPGTMLVIIRHPEQVLAEILKPKQGNY